MLGETFDIAMTHIADDTPFIPAAQMDREGRLEVWPDGKRWFLTHWECDGEISITRTPYGEPQLDFSGTAHKFEDSRIHARFLRWWWNKVWCPIIRWWIVTAQGQPERSA